MSGRPGFMLYFADMNAIMAAMDDAHFGAFMRAVINYAQDGAEPTGFDPMGQLAFGILRQKLDRDIGRGHVRDDQRDIKRVSLHAA